MRRLIAGLFIWLALASAAGAQPVVDSKMTEFTRPSGLFDTGPRLASPPDAERLIRATLASDSSYGEVVRRQVADKDFYVILHIIKWADPAADQGDATTQTVQAQNWYVYRGGSGWSAADFTNAKRLFGSKGFYLLVVHLNHNRKVNDYRLSYVVTVVKKQATNVANLLAAAKLMGVDFGTYKGASRTPEAAPRDLWAGAFVPIADVPSDVTIAPAIVDLGTLPPAPTAKTAGDSDDLFESDAAADAAADAKAAEAIAPEVAKQLDSLREQVKKLEGQLAATKAGPTARAPAPAPQSLGDAQKFDNEGNYWWDVSIGVPVRKVSDFQRTEAGLDVKTVSKSTIFALFNVFVPKVDLKSPALRAIPHALVGFGVEDENPLHRIFVGGGWGPVYANFFAGYAWKRVEADGKVTWPGEVTFGVNVPVLTITKRLAAQAK